MLSLAACRCQGCSAREAVVIAAVAGQDAVGCGPQCLVQKHTRILWHRLPHDSFMSQPCAVLLFVPRTAGCVLTWVVALPDVENAPVGPQRAYAYDLASVRMVQPAAAWKRSSSLKAAVIFTPIIACPNRWGSSTATLQHTRPIVTHIIAGSSISRQDACTPSFPGAAPVSCAAAHLCMGPAGLLG
jgi:hypothetical protein